MTRCPAAPPVGDGSKPRRSRPHSTREAARGTVAGTSDAPHIGVFDSGVGGLSVVRTLRARLPYSEITYVADSANAPYGPRPVEWVCRRSAELTTALVERGCDAVVIACNTATAAAAESLRARWPLPIIGMEPAVKPAAAATRSGVVAVFATDGTLASRRFAALLERYASGLRVVVEPCGDLVDFAERGVWNGPVVTRAARRHVERIVAAGADTLVLGCTHFPLLERVLAPLADGCLTVIETSDAVARQVQRQLGDYGAAARRPTVGPLHLMTSGRPSHLHEIASRVLGPDQARTAHALDPGGIGDRPPR